MSTSFETCILAPQKLRSVATKSDRIRPASTNISSFRTNTGEARTKSSGNRASFGRGPHNSDRPRLKLGEAMPNLTELGPHQNETAPRPVESGPNSAKFGPTLGRVAPRLTETIHNHCDVFQSSPGFGQCWCEHDVAWHKFRQSSLDVGRFGTMSTQCGQSGLACREFAGPAPFTSL